MHVVQCACSETLIASRALVVSSATFSRFGMKSSGGNNNNTTMLLELWLDYADFALKLVLYLVYKYQY